jgi:hypothetical protein
MKQAKPCRLPQAAIIILQERELTDRRIADD